MGRVHPLSWILLLIVFVQVHAAADDNDDPGSKTTDIKVGFEKFFNPKTGADAFHKFLKESGRKMGLKGLDDKDDEDKKDDDDDGKKDDKKKLSEEEASLPAKVFVFYLKTYDCAKSKVYKEFATNYKNNSLITSDVDEDVDDKWLKKLAKKDIDVDDPDKASVGVDEANKKLAKLSEDQIAKLDKGVTEMPLEAQIVIHFVKVIGCQDSKLDDYKKFNDMMKEQISKAKSKGKKITASYCIAKAQTILHDEF